MLMFLTWAAAVAMSSRAGWHCFIRIGYCFFIWVGGLGEWVKKELHLIPKKKKVIFTKNRFFGPSSKNIRMNWRMFFSVADVRHKKGDTSWTKTEVWFFHSDSFWYWRLITGESHKKTDWQQKLIRSKKPKTILDEKWKNLPNHYWNKVVAIFQCS